MTAPAVEAPRVRPPPTLRRMLRSDAFLRVVVGPVGSGKSSACVQEILRRACGQAAGADSVRRTRFAVVRNTYRELHDTTRKTFEAWIPTEIGKWAEVDFTFHLRFDPGDGTIVESEIMFRALDRPGDVKKLLSLELTGAYVNELREIAKPILDALQTRVGRYPSSKDGGATWSGIWADTNPSHSQHWLVGLFARAETLQAGDRRLTIEDERTGVRTVLELYRQPSGRSADAENVENLDPAYYSRLLATTDSEWQKVYVDGLDATTVVGSIWGESLAQCPAPAEYEHGSVGVFTAWDLGRSDSTAIWFFRVAGREKLDVIDYYENHLQGLAHYADVLDRRGYEYAKHWLPHDARARTLASEVSVQDQLSTRWPGKVSIGPGLSLQDGIAAGRWLLEGRCRIHARCKAGVEALHAYRREWDEDRRAYSERPVHDWSSHGCDAWRYMATVARHTGLIMAEKPVPEAPVIPGVDKTFTLEGLFAERARSLGRGRRV